MIDHVTPTLTVVDRGVGRLMLSVCSHLQTKRLRVFQTYFVRRLVTTWRPLQLQSFWRSKIKVTESKN